MSGERGGGGGREEGRKGRKRGGGTGKTRSRKWEELLSLETVIGIYYFHTSSSNRSMKALDLPHA
jgi:hypothetical protein